MVSIVAPDQAAEVRYQALGSERLTGHGSSTQVPQTFRKAGSTEMPQKEEWQTLNHWSYSAPASLRVGLCAVSTLYEFLLADDNIGKLVGVSGNYCIFRMTQGTMGKKPQARVKR